MQDKETHSVTSEVTRWFFFDDLPVGVGNGPSNTGAEFILEFWGVPLYDYDPEGGLWALNGDAVTGLLEVTHTRLKANGHAYTEVIDRSVRAYHDNGAAIEVIWSRRRADDTEIERLAAHFEVIRTKNGWRVAGIQHRPTHADTLSEAWGVPGDGDLR